MKIKMLRTDRGGEFTPEEFSNFCRSHGIKRLLVAPFSPQQNGVVDRKNMTIFSTVRVITCIFNLNSYLI